MMNQPMNPLTPAPGQLPNFPPQMVNIPGGIPNMRPEFAMGMPMPPMPPMPQNPQANPASQGVSLYVGNLDPEVNEQRLYEHFVQYGHIINTKVMRDSYNGESRGFGFVTFANLNDALRAKSLLNYTKILDREIRIALKRNPSELNQSANLFFKNVDPTITSKKLEEECSKFGSIISCVVKVDEENLKPLGYAYVQFENQQNADECVQQMNNMKMGEKNISVGVFLPKNKRQNPYSKSNLYIKQFPESWKEDKIREFVNSTFGVYGAISSLGVFEDKNIQKMYAFVAFDDQDVAQKAYNELNDHEIPESDDKLYVAYAQDKATRKRTLKAKHMKFKNETNLYIKSLKPEVTNDQVTEAFAKFGKVTSVCIKTHEPKIVPGAMPQTDKPRLNFGFINFSTADEAKFAFTECKKDSVVMSLLDEGLLTRGGEFVYYAQSKTVRQQYLRMQKKNMKTFKSIQDNVLQYYQLMKYFMPQNFRANNKPGNKNMNMSNRGRGANNYRNRGNGRGFYKGSDRGDMSQFSGNTPAPNQQGGTPTPQPNMMFNNDLGAFGMPPNMAMPGMSGNFGSQMMNQGQMASMMNMNQNPQVGVAGIPAQVNAQAINKDLNWLKANMEEFEAIDDNEKKNILGNLMYPLVEKEVDEADHVPKITGMLIDLEVLAVNEIIEILEADEYRSGRIQEAVAIIRDSE